MKLVKQLAGLFLIAAFTFVPNAQASIKKVELIVSIDKRSTSCEQLLTEELTELKDFLEYRDPTMSNEYVHANIVQYIDYCTIAPEAPYYGIAIVELEYTSEVKKDFYIDRLSSACGYTLYSNPGVGH